VNSFTNKTDTSSKSTNPYRVMVVDDSAIIRGFLCRYLSEDVEIDVVTTANNGKVALRQLDNYDIEAVVLDIEMPEMDGLTALPLMIEKKSDLQVVMASTLTRKNAEVSLKALQMGAVDYVPKPETARSVNASIDFRRELVEKVKAWAATRRRKRGEDAPGSASTAGVSAGAGGFVKPSRPATTGFVSASRPKAAPTFASTGRGAEARGTTLAVTPANDAGSNLKLVPGSRRKPKILGVGSQYQSQKRRTSIRAPNQTIPIRNGAPYHAAHACDLYSNPC